MSKSAILFFIGTLLTAISSSAHAFDGNRQGFVIGLGIGAHTSELNYQRRFAPTRLESKKQIASSLLVGYGIDNQVLLHVGGKGGGIVINDREASLVIAGLGGSFYFEQSSPSLYLTGLIGSGSVSLDDENDGQDDEGTGWLVGIGYEITHRLHLEFSHAKANLVDPRQTSNKYRLTSSFLTMQYLWY